MIVSVAELHQQRKSSIQNGVRSDTRAWQVVTDDISDGTASAIYAPGIPRFNDPGAANTKVTSVEASPVDESDVVFVVTVEYGGGDVEEIPLHPLDRAPEWSWNATEFTEPYFYDQSNPRKPFTTSAGDSFETLWERGNSDLNITCVRNEQFHDVLEADEFKHTINADIVFLDGQGYAPGTLLLGPITAVKTTETWMGTEVTYYKRTYTFSARKKGWDDKPLDVGCNQLRERTVNIGGVPTVIKERLPIVDATGRQVTKPWPLDGNGKAKPSATDVAAELTFRPHAHVAFYPLAFS